MRDLLHVLMTAIARVNGHSHPEAWADQVMTHADAGIAAFQAKRPAEQSLNVSSGEAKQGSPTEALTPGNATMPEAHATESLPAAVEGTGPPHTETNAPQSTTSQES